MLTRRSFLTRALLGAAAIPLASKLAAEPATQTTTGSLGDAMGGLGNAGQLYVQGLAIKVPSNRTVAPWYREGVPEGTLTASYVGSWDGTFKLERGCSNPSYILADLYDRTGEEPDWVVAIKPSISPFAPMVMDGMHQLLKPRLDWALLYHWGQWCDQLATETQHVEMWNERVVGHRVMRRTLGPRFTVNTVCATREDMVTLRESLRMHCLDWQSTDPRYRTSWPGIPYPTPS